MDADGKGFRAIAQDAKGLRTVMTSTLEQSEALKTSLLNWSAAVQGLQSVERAVNQISGQLNSITAESRDFSKAMKEANTMAGKDSAGFKQLKGEVAELAKTLPIARDQLANGLYQTISNGVPEDNWIEFLNKSARSAVGGLANINKVVGVTSTVIKNYGLEWSAAGDIQDKIQLTAKNGRTSFDELSQSLPRVTGNAATLDVSIDELMGSFATLTGVSGNTAEVSTQLAAIFTALIKPSSEAAEMAAKMGIQFDTAAIKAAGGFQNFLSQLNQSVKSYARANGVLEQEVYGRLFGSAEAIRALIPLQGELSDKFAANIANMVNSAGTMDAAYNEMVSTGGAVNQMLRNQWATVIDVISGFTSAAQPYINFSAGLLSTASSAAILVTTFKQLNIHMSIATMRAKLASVAMAMLGLRGKSTAAVVRVLSGALKTGAFRATAFKIALRGLLIATGVGAAIAAVTTIIEYFVGATDDATESTNKFLSAEERAKRDAEELEQMRQQEAATLTQTRAALEQNISRLKEFNGTAAEEKRIVNELNNTYGDTMGYFSSVADWYKALISNSESYCRQMIIEAQTRRLANQIAQKEQENHDIIYNPDGTLRKYSTKKGLSYETTKPGPFSSEDDGPQVQLKETESDWEKATNDFTKNKADIADMRKQLDRLSKDAGKIDFSVKGSATPPQGAVYQPLGKPSGRPSRTSDNSVVEPTEVNENASNLKEIGDNLKVLQSRLEEANTLEDASEINKQIEAWQKKAEAIRGAGKAVKSNNPVFRADATSLAQITENISALSDQLNAVSSIEDAAEINKQIEVWQKKADAIRDAGKAVESNGPVFRANATNLAQITENISALSDQLNEVSSIDEAAEINRQIEAWEEKADAIRNAGKEAKVTFDTLRSGWDSVKGIGSGIDGITNALKGNANAWQTVTGIVEGFLQVFDGIKAIVELINMFTRATEDHARSELADAVAVQGKTAATVAETTASAAATAATEAETTAAATNIAAKSGEAIADATASGAKMPFPANLIAIPTGVAAVLNALAGIGAFATGGIVGGNSKSGDRLLARVNSGEMILNATQQRNLFRMINTPAAVRIPQYNAHEVNADMGFIQTITREPVIIGGTLRAHGREIICVLANETRIASKSGKKTNIVI